MNLDHSTLCRLAARWVRKKHRCTVVLEDVQTLLTSEQPDVIAWQNGGYSVLVEVKVSVHDLKRDSKKRFRKISERGMGQERWYAVPTGFYRPELDPFFPTGWGIVELGTTAKIIRRPFPFPSYASANEKRLLITSVRRLVEGWGRGMFGDAAEGKIANGDPHPIRRIRELEAEVQGLRRLNERLKRGNEIAPVVDPLKDVVGR